MACIAHNIEAEQAVIGSLVMDFNTAEEFTYILTPDDFESDKCKEIYQTVMKLKADNQIVNIVTLTQLLDGKYKTDIVNWCNNAPAFSDLRCSVEIVKSNATIRRTQIALSEYVLSPQESINASDLICSIEQKLEQIKKTALISHNGETNFQKHAREYLKHLDNKEPVKKFTTDYADLDKIIGGLPIGELTGIAARPGVGKTTLAVNLAYRFWKRGERVLIDSLEMPEEQMIQKLAEIDTGINAEHVRDYNFADWEREQIKKSVNRFTADDRMEVIGDGYTVQKLMSNAKQHKADVVLVDYLTYMIPEKPGANRNAEVGSISRSLKFMAKKLQIPVVVLCQLNRDVEKKFPQKSKPAVSVFSLSDLRDSGEIEQDLAVVMFLDRKGLSDPSVPLERMDVVIAKNRFGRTGTTKLRFDLATQRIFSPDNIHAQMEEKYYHSYNDEAGGDRPF